MTYCYGTRNYASHICLILIFGGISTTFAQMKEVQVDFRVVEDKYQLFYGDSVTSLEKKGSEIIALRLHERFPFVKFGTRPGDTKVIMTLDREKTGLVNPLIQQIDLSMKLVSAQGITSDQIAFEFRSEDRFYEPLPHSFDAFILELDHVLDLWLENEQESIISEVMSFVSLAEKALPDVQNKCWIMPFSEDSLMIGSESEFIVKSKLITPDIIRNIKYEAVAAGRVQLNSPAYPPEYHGKILASIKPAALIDLDKMTHTGLRIEGIYITKFIRAILMDPFTPFDFDLPE